MIDGYLQSELIHTRHQLLAAQNQVDALTERTRDVKSISDICCCSRVFNKIYSCKNESYGGELQILISASLV